MYLPIGQKNRVTNRKKTNRRNAAHKARQRRRVNGMHGRKLGRRLKRNGG